MVSAPEGEDGNVENMEKKRQKIAELRHELGLLEVDMALQESMATIHGITPGETEGELQLGPTLRAEVEEVEEVPVSALLDTGSLATIVSLKCILGILERERPNFPSAELWRADVERRLEPSALHLRSYGGGRLDLVRQLKVSLSTPDHVVDATIQVQQGAPIDLLLGTDLQPQLGFALLEDVLQGKRWRVCPEEEQQSQEDSVDAPTVPTAGIVRLLQATRLPAQYGKVVRAQVEGWQHRTLSTALFVPEQRLIETSGLDVPDAAVELEDNRFVSLFLENPSIELLQLPEGQVLGRVESVDLQGVVDIPQSNTVPTTIHALEADSRDPNRGQRLRDAIHLEETSLSATQQEALKSLIHRYEDQFGLDDSELGSTSLVEQNIDTGTAAPIHQPARRTPFALRARTEELVEGICWSRG